ncbi:MAG: magnesium/cobalt transporter CorA [bacterium]
MLHILLFSETGQLVETHDLKLLEEALNDRRRVWVDLDEPTDSELEILDSVFRFHPLAVEDVKSMAGVPKINLYETYAFLVLHRVFYHFDREECERREFEVFFSEQFIVTIHRAHLARTFGTARERVREEPQETLGKGTPYVLFHLLDLAVKDHEPVIEQWQEMLEEIEHQVLKGAHEKILDQILQFKKLVTTMRKNLLPERDVIKQLYEKSLPCISAEARPYFKNVLDDMQVLLQELESLKEHAASVFDVYAAMLSIKMTESSNNLNFVMQRLTIAATIFLPLTFIVGVYGMNFDYMPEFHWKGFYYLLWFIMIGVAGGMIFFFKKKKWL